MKQLFFINARESMILRRGRDACHALLRFPILADLTSLRAGMIGCMDSRQRIILTRWVGMLVACLSLASISPLRAADDRYHSDSDARYVHHISLYDIDNRKITPESDRPYSSVNTCGRCHDYQTISHGWHFNAFQPDTSDGRQGEPWIWTDDKTGTQLPLSYRKWVDVYRPDSVGISKWEMTLKFGGRIPGGNMGSEANVDPVVPDNASDEATPTTRWQFSGNLQIDCMICHAVSGAYDFGERRQQVSDENFAWAPTAAIRLGKIEGRVSSIKDGSDIDDEATQKKMPKVVYDASRFNHDNTVFMDLIREPSSNACFQCHSNRPVSESGIEPRWMHDDDVHLRAGMQCVDCHRNGIDHHIVRGFDGEEHPSGVAVETLSCTGCHLGEAAAEDEAPIAISSRAGRLGSPMPAHAGLPPLHFDKLSCTACHGGPIPSDQANRMMTSLAHGLGEKGHRTGLELPAIVAPVFAKGEDGRVYPHRAMWPAFWGHVSNGKIVPIPPTQAYDLTRRALRVRTSFVDEILKPKISSSDLKELLGEDRAKESESWTPEEQAKFDEAQKEAGLTNFNEKIYKALDSIETELKVQPAVYVSSGHVYKRGDEENTLTKLEVDDPLAIDMVKWPIAHNVRPAGWALGAGGCTDCHRDDAKIFASTVVSIGPGPDQGASITMAQLQGVNPEQRLSWNEMFQGRATFKYFIAGSIAILSMILLVGVGALVGRLVGRTT